MMKRRSSDRVGCQYAIQLFVSVAATAVVVAGCSDPADGFVRRVAARVTNAPWHEQNGWKAADFFADPKVVALGDAIVANDLDRMKDLIATGADVNARGKGNMTPLLWAFFDNKPERFRLLLEAGADPNVYTLSDFGTPQAMRPGDSVTHMACRGAFEHFWEVFRHGGDPNLPNKLPGLTGRTPLHLVITSGAKDKKERLTMLVEKGAELNPQSSGRSPLAEAESHAGQYDLCLHLLDLGVDPNSYYEPAGTTLGNHLMHMLCASLEDKDRGTGHLALASPARVQAFERLIERLEAKGESMDAVKAQRRRWKDARDLRELHEMQRKEGAEHYRRMQQAARDAESREATTGSHDSSGHDGRHSEPARP